MTDGISAGSRTVVSLFSIFELSKGFVVVDSETIIEGGSAGISSKDDNAPSLRCTDEIGRAHV